MLVRVNKTKHKNNLKITKKPPKTEIDMSGQSKTKNKT